MNLYKYHALGNDYWIFDPTINPHENIDEVWIKNFCDRHKGLGGDGVLVGPKQIGENIFGVKIYNSDGTLAEISGNGLTIFSRYLCDAQQINLNEKICLIPSQKCCVHVINTEKNNIIYSNISLGIGQVTEIIKFHIPNDLRNLYSLPEIVDLYKVNMGNPHCVVPIKNPTKAIAYALGSLLETHQAFPNKTNVQFVDWNEKLLTARIEIWERGSGYTLGSGSSSCAVACAFGKHFQLENYTLNLNMPGGQLVVVNKNQVFSFTNRAYKIAGIRLITDDFKSNN